MHPVRRFRPAGWVCGALFVFLVCPTVAHSDDLEPDTGVFARDMAPSPYHLQLRRVLLEDSAHLCQFVILPSFSEETAVYIDERVAGAPVVVSRTMKPQLWATMCREIRNDGKTESIRFDATTQASALARLNPVVVTREAEIDADTFNDLTLVCREVLLRARYDRYNSSIYLTDGTTYHIGTWNGPAFISGKIKSPKPGTLVAAFVEMGRTLKAYAEAAPDERRPIKNRLDDQIWSVTQRALAE